MMGILAPGMVEAEVAVELQESSHETGARPNPYHTNAEAGEVMNWVLSEESYHSFILGSKQKTNKQTTSINTAEKEKKKKRKRKETKNAKKRGLWEATSWHLHVSTRPHGRGYGRQPSTMHVACHPRPEDPPPGSRNSRIAVQRRKAHEAFLLAREAEQVGSRDDARRCMAAVHAAHMGSCARREMQVDLFPGTEIL
jgi:hypothetical protein